MMNWNGSLRKYMKEHLTLYIFVSVLFVMGIIFGALLVNALSLEQREELSQSLGAYFHMIEQETDWQGKRYFQQSFGSNVKWILFIWMLGLTVIGFPFILVLNFLKGILLGFTIGYLVNQLSWNGLLFAMVSIAPQNVIIIPVFIICSVSGISFALTFIKNRLLRWKNTPLSESFYQYSFVTICLVFTIFAVSLFETFITPRFIEWITPVVMTSMDGMNVIT